MHGVAAWDQRFHRGKLRREIAAGNAHVASEPSTPWSGSRPAGAEQRELHAQVRSRRRVGLVHHPHCRGLRGRLSKFRQSGFSVTFPSATGSSVAHHTIGLLFCTSSTDAPRIYRPRLLLGSERTPRSSQSSTQSYSGPCPFPRQMRSRCYGRTRRISPTPPWPGPTCRTGSARPMPLPSSGRSGVTIMRSRAQVSHKPCARAPSTRRFFRPPTFLPCGVESSAWMKTRSELRHWSS